MHKSRSVVIVIGIITTLLCMLFMFPVLSASGADDLESATVDSQSVTTLSEGLSTEGTPAQAEETAPNLEGITPWGTPVQVSPNSGTALAHYPRWTTVAWQRVTTATAYKVERAYLSGSTWVAYPAVTVSGINNASYSFSFVGDQTGRWRVSAYNGSVWTAPSSWWTFSYRTKAQMPTPIVTNPYPSEVFDHYPRTTMLSWKMIPAAYGYKVERQYLSGTTWVSYPTVTITGYLNARYTFNFIGAQQGRWRVTALGGTNYYDSAPTAWYYFRYGI